MRLNGIMRCKYAGLQLRLVRPATPVNNDIDSASASSSAEHDDVESAEQSKDSSGDKDNNGPPACD